MQGLDRIFSRASQINVLRTLYHSDEPLTGREIERRTSLSNRATMLALESLMECSAVTCDNTPQANWYELNMDNYLIKKAIKPCFDAEDLFWDDLKKTIWRVVHPRPIATVVPGPMARDEQLSSGRLSLTMLFSTGRNRIRAFGTLDNLVETIENRYALSIDPHLLDINIMDREEYDSLWKRVEREGILLFGTLP